MVSDLWISGSGEWDVELLHDLFCVRDVEEITKILVCRKNAEDYRLWNFTKNCENGEHKMRRKYIYELLVFSFHCCVYI